VRALCGSLSVDQLDLLAPTGIDERVVELLAVLEPVKWYARLLGAEALAARLQGTEMPQARPYQLSTPLCSVADVLSPQSFRTAQLEQLLDRWCVAPLTGDDRRVLLQWLADWRGQTASLRALDVTEGRTLEALAERLAEFASCLEQLVNLAGERALRRPNRVSEILAVLDAATLRCWLEPVDELMLAVVAPALALAISLEREAADQ